MDNLEIDPRELKQRIESGETLLLVDVREPWEHQLCSIQGAKLVPLSELGANLALFEKSEKVVLYCHHGIRSLNAAAWLRSQGVDSARSLAGGIERWAAEIDPGLARY